MTETTGKEASTLHRLLEIGKVDDDDLVKQYNYEGSPIDADVIIVDELSMNANYTNEGGIGKTTRFLKNIMGLWIPLMNVQS